MKKLQLALVCATLLGTTLGAAAQSLKPGLWEISNKMTSGSGEMERAMAQAQKQLSSMPAEQRKMMEDMMANQGVGMGMNAGITTIKICMTKEMVERDEVVKPQQGDCKHTSSPRSGNVMKFSFVCTEPASSGEGQVTFLGPQAYNMKMAINTTTNGKAETMKMDATAKFLSTECGNIRPIALPKQ